MSAYRLIRPLLFALEAERAHRLAIWALKRGGRSAPPPDDPVLATEVLGRAFANPVGIAAGFDKHAEAPAQLWHAGFGFVELGTVTPRPQPGNPRPRVFRLAEDRAVVNRLGFNSVGLEQFARNLVAARARAPADFRARAVIGVNLGKNRDTEAENAAWDYALGVRGLAPVAGYLVINVSSPNTPGLRGLQGPAALAEIVRVARLVLPNRDPPPILIKIAPDLDEARLAEIAGVVGAGGIDGLIVSNTTVQRPPGLRSALRREEGGLSGAPLKPLALAALRAVFRLTGGTVPLIGVGGIASGADAYARIRAGASLVQLYTALVYDGAGLVARVKRDLAALLRRDGYARVADAVGADARSRAAA